ncbi:hypothetical protein RMQ97_01495 [Maricaulis sp. D1M11]|uniref:hypothetical protein n=1 Tax=Maricaulis sp. D1M11 TaxID=3076117 RepID=UPI0039B45205
MSNKRRLVRVAGLVLAGIMSASLSACAIYEGTDAVCPNGDPNADNWPYCGPASPGGYQPTQDPVYG